MLEFADNADTIIRKWRDTRQDGFENLSFAPLWAMLSRSKLI